MKRKTLIRLIVSLGLSLAQGRAAAELRELATDRPDVTECPFTVDAGHFQLEMDLAAFNRAGGSDSVSFGNFNAKIGLTPYSDLQLGFEPLIHTASASGNGDFVARLKVNFWGNDGGKTAFAIMPFIKAPTATTGFGNGATEGGVIFPLAFDLGAGFGLGTMAEFDFNQNAADLGYHCDRMLSASLSKELPADLGCYLEYVNVQSGEQNVDSASYIDFGFTYGLTPVLQFDLGLNSLVAAPISDQTAFAGLSFKL